MTPRKTAISRVSGATAAAVAFALLPSRAEAHLVTTGLGPVYDGISHVLMSPDDLVPILAMALLAGLNGPAAGRRALFVFTGAWLAGGIAGYLAGHTVFPGATTALSFLVIGGLTAADRRLSPNTVAGLAIAIGLLHGWLNGAGIAEAQNNPLGLAGIVSVIFVLVALASALVVSLRAEWMRIAVRVAGSWVAAIGLLMFGWSLRG
jgi:hydrogenase/urease accessory protein HupE